MAIEPGAREDKGSACGCRIARSDFSQAPASTRTLAAAICNRGWASQAAERETQEELGLVIPVGTLQKQFKIDACADTGWEFVWVYTGPVLSPVVPNPDEIESVTALSRSQIETLLATQPESCARSFRRILSYVFTRHLFPAPFTAR